MRFFFFALTVRSMGRRFPSTSAASASDAKKAPPRKANPPTMSATNILANLQGHQIVLQRELEEINSDLVQLQQMGARYTLQNGISFSPAVEQLMILRAEKETLLQQVTLQLTSMQSTIASSSQLVTQLQHQPFVAPPPPPPATVATTSPSRTTRWGGSRSAFASVDAPLSAFAGGVPNGMVHLTAPGGLMVTTNSTILSNSPARQRW